MYQLMDPHTKRHDEGLFEQVPEAVYERVTAKDPCWKSGGAAPSVEAWERVKALTGDDHYTIMRLIQTRRQKGRGITAKAYARDVGMIRKEKVDLNAVSGRFSELKNARRIMRHPDWRRNKSGVWILFSGSIEERGEAA